MPDSQPYCLSGALAEEFQALRNEPSFAPADPNVSEAALRAELYKKVHQQPQPFSALCISGGGIRSATFALGALQSLADRGLLKNFDYVSTVSGGGYIGSWLTAWIQRSGGIANVEPKLRRDAPKPVAPEPDPVQHLRDYNNYLTPKLGLFSTDTWTVAATVIRNMMLNWLVLVPLLLFALAIPRVAVSLVTLRQLAGATPPQGWDWVMAVTTTLVHLLIAIAIFNCVRYLPGVGNVAHTQGDFLRYVLTPLVTGHVLHCTYFYWWWLDTMDGLPTIWHEIGEGLTETFLGWFAYLIVCAIRDRRKAFRELFGPITFAMFLLGVGVGVFSWTLFTKIYPSDHIGISHFIALGPPLLLSGFSVAGSLFIGLTSGVLGDDDREWLSRGGAWLTLVILGWAGICSLVLLAPEYMLALGVWLQSGAAGLGALSGITAAKAGYSGKSKSQSDAREPKAQSWQMSLALKLAPPVFVTVFFIGLAILTNVILDKAGLSPRVWWDHNGIVEKTSLAVNAGAAIVFLALSLIMSRYININIFSLHGMYRNRLIRAYLGASNPKRNASAFTGFAPDDNMKMNSVNTAHKPLHVLNLTLNLVSGERLAWQQRKAESFTVTPLHCGSGELGYRPSAQYGDGISLGTALAISGAAASPNMGYHSSPVIGFIMTLFNARLGAWLGNPGLYGEKTWTHQGPYTATASLMREAFGLTNSRSKYVYLSDGGHFENLGLYEMVARRCRNIVVLDSAADPSLVYEDLGNALRKIRIDMNIPIEFEQALVAPLQSRKKRCAVARIRYSMVDGACPDGHLIYIKPLYLGNEQPDVQSYHAAAPSFPHESTGDQWFSESQTESYRMLGLHTVDEICRNIQGATANDLRFAAEEYVKSGAEPGLSSAAGA